MTVTLEAYLTEVSNAVAMFSRVSLTKADTFDVNIYVRYDIECIAYAQKLGGLTPAK